MNGFVLWCLMFVKFSMLLSSQRFPVSSLMIWRGFKDMLHTLARLLKECNWLVKGVTFDASQAHTFLREALMGSFKTLRKEDLLSVEFFCDCTYIPLPDHVLPRLPGMICMHAGKSVWGLPGPCPFDKHYQAISGHIRSMYVYVVICILRYPKSFGRFVRLDLSWFV